MPQDRVDRPPLLEEFHGVESKSPGVLNIPPDPESRVKYAVENMAKIFSQFALMKIPCPGSYGVSPCSGHLSLVAAKNHTEHAIVRCSAATLNNKELRCCHYFFGLAECTEWIVLGVTMTWPKKPSTTGTAAIELNADIPEIPWYSRAINKLNDSLLNGEPEELQDLAKDLVTRLTNGASKAILQAIPNRNKEIKEVSSQTSGLTAKKPTYVQMAATSQSPEDRSIVLQNRLAAILQAPQRRTAPSNTEDNLPTSVYFRIFRTRDVDENGRSLHMMLEDLGADKNKLFWVSMIGNVVECHVATSYKEDFIAFLNLNLHAGDSTVQILRDFDPTKASPHFEVSAEEEKQGRNGVASLCCGLCWRAWFERTQVQWLRTWIHERISETNEFALTWPKSRIIPHWSEYSKIIEEDSVSVNSLNQL